LAFVSNINPTFQAIKQVDTGKNISPWKRVRTITSEVPGLAAVIAVLGFAIFMLADDSFGVNMLAVALLFAGLGVSWNIVGGLGGQFSMAHSVFFAVGAYTAANLYLHFQVSPWVSLIPAALLSAGLACLISWPVFRLKGPFFAIATMAFTEVALALAMHFTSITGGASGLSVPFKAGLENMIFRQRWSYAVLMLGYCAVALIVMVVITRSRLGYYLQAVRDNENAALASGISVIRTKLAGMAISAALTGMGGVIFVMYVRVVDPSSLLSLFDIGVKIALIALIGGIGTIYGPLLGALLIVPLDLTLRAYIGSKLPGGNLLVLGIILIFASLFLKQGIFGAIMSIKASMMRRKS
jgi:branched-chain amino acid transport system permease protein